MDHFHYQLDQFHYQLDQFHYQLDQFHYRLDQFRKFNLIKFNLIINSFVYKKNTWKCQVLGTHLYQVGTRYKFHFYSFVLSIKGVMNRNELIWIEMKLNRASILPIGSKRLLIGSISLPNGLIKLQIGSISLKTW